MEELSLSSRVCGSPSGMQLKFTLLVVLVAVVSAYDSPQYTVVHTESDFEIRRYRATVWMTSQQEDLSFRSATQKGFHKLFQYIQGANLNSSRVPMTTPVITGIVPSTGPFCSSTFRVRFYVPPEFQDSPPVGLAELKVKAEYWDEQCIATRKFSGFAKDDNVVVEAAKLAASLSKTKWWSAVTEEAKPGVDSYSIAQYNSPFELFNRRNEVWVLLPGCSPSDNCAPDQVETV